VVNTMAMTALGAHSTLLKETFDVDPRVGVHHLGYFAEPTVSMRLAGWLGFDLPQDSAMDLAPTTLVTTYVMKRPSSHPSPAEGVQVSKILEVGADDDLRVASIAVDWSDEAAPITTRNPVLQD